MHPIVHRAVRRTALLSLLALPLRAHADTVYTSAAAFATANPGLTTVTFDGIAPSAGYVNEGTDFTMGGAHFVSSQKVNVNSANFYPVTYPQHGYKTYNSGGYLVPTTNALETLTINVLPSTAIGLNLGGLFGLQSFTLTLSDGFSTPLNTTNSVTLTGALDFFGVTASSPLTSLTITDTTNGSVFAFDNVSYGNAPVVASTPEPSSLLLLATGLTGLAAAVRRRLQP